MTRFHFHGDSTMHGWETNAAGQSTGRLFPPWEHAEWQLRKVATKPFEMRHFTKVGGGMVDQFTQRNYDEGTFPQYLQKTDAHVIVCNWLINDAYDPRIVNISDFRDSYAHLANIALGRGKRFVIQTPNPTVGAHAARRFEFSASLRTIPGIDLIDIETAILQRFPHWQSFLTDGIHPGQIMYRYIGDLMFEELRRFL